MTALLKKAEFWWRNTEFTTMEIVTGYNMFEFSDEDGYQDFVDACDEWWNGQSKYEKIDIYKEFAD